MERVRFGKTELMVSKLAFGALPIQRLSESDAVSLIRGAVDLGINFFDTANGYSDSEEKIGKAIKGMKREDIIIASKSIAKDKKTFLEHIDVSLKRMGVDYIDIYQHHHLSSEQSYNQVFGEDGAFEGLCEAVKAGKVRFPGFSSHNIPVASKIMNEKKFDMVQIPFNFIDDVALNTVLPLAKELDMGFIAMKPFGGGLLTDANLAIKYLYQFDGIVADPGFETLSQVNEVVGIIKSGEKFSEADAKAVAKLKAELGGSWCHRCDYCQPCPKKIVISAVLTVESITKRMTYERANAFLGSSMENARDCNECRLCVAKCPYDLDIPKLLKEKLVVWDKYVSENK